MAAERTELNRLDVLRALRISNWEAVYATAHATLTTGAFQTGFALWLGCNDFWMGVLGAIPTFAGLSQMFSSYIVEKRGERRLITAWFSIAGRSLWVPILFIPVVMRGMHGQFAAFMLLFLLSSLLINFPLPAFTSWISDLVPPDHRGRYFGRRNMLAGITVMVVSLPAGWFLDLAVKYHHFSMELGFGVLFALAALCGTFSFICLLRQAEPPMQKMKTDSAQGFVGMLQFYKAPLKEKNFRQLMYFSASFAVAQFIAAPFYTVYCLNVLKLSYTWLQILGAVASLTSLLSMPLWGYLGDKFGNKPLLGIAVFGTGLLPLAWVFTSPQHMTLSIILIFINNALGGLFWAGVGLTGFNLLIGATPTERKSVYIGVMSAVTGLAGGAAPIVGGMMMTLLQNTHFNVASIAFSNFQIIFTFNSLLRYGTLFFLKGVSDSGSKSSAKEVLTQLGGTRVGAWVQIRKLQHSQKESERRQAAQALRGTKTALAVEELTAALTDPSQHLREEAAIALGEIGDPRAVDPLIASLSDSASGIVKETVDALGRLSDKRAVPVISQLLQNGESADKPFAARALGRIGGTEARDALIKAVESNDSLDTPEVRESCVLALGSIGDASSVPAIVKQINGAPRALRIACIRALGDIGAASAGDALLAILTTETDPSVVSRAAVSLAMCGIESAVGPLLESLQRITSPVARKQVLNAVGAMMGEGEAFYPLLSMETYGRDEAVARILREIGKKARRGDQSEFGPRRRIKLAEVALERYMAGDITRTMHSLSRLARPDEEESADSPALQAYRWAFRTSKLRELSSEEFLLALFAARIIVNS